MSATAWFTSEIRGRHVLIGLLAFFGLIFLANGVFVYYALTTFGGGEKGSPYRSGLRYNETLAEAARAAERGFEGRVSYDPKTTRLALALRDRNGPSTSTGNRLNSPSNRRSSGKIPPSNTPIPRMCAAFTNR